MCFPQESQWLDWSEILCHVAAWSVSGWYMWHCVWGQRLLTRYFGFGCRFYLILDRLLAFDTLISKRDTHVRACTRAHTHARTHAHTERKEELQSRCKFVCLVVLFVHTAINTYYWNRFSCNWSTSLKAWLLTFSWNRTHIYIYIYRKTRFSVTPGPRTVQEGSSMVSCR